MCTTPNEIEPELEPELYLDESAAGFLLQGVWGVTVPVPREQVVIEWQSRHVRHGVLLDLQHSNSSSDSPRDQMKVTCRSAAASCCCLGDGLLRPATSSMESNH